MKPIFIIGYMAAGKTTFGRALAHRLGMQFIDLDFFITQRFHTSVSEIFRSKGEERFRSIETNILREVGEFDDVIISCGGGTPCHSGNIGYMNSRGITVLLEASLERTLERIRLAPGKRPLIVGKSDGELREYILRHKDARAPFYNAAQIHIPSDALESRAQIASTIDAFLLLLPA